MPQRVSYPQSLRELEVLRTSTLGTGFVRVVLGGPSIRGFHSHADLENITLIFPDAAGELTLPSVKNHELMWPATGCVARDLAVRDFDSVTGELTIDIVVHPGGVASEWACSVRPGATIHVAGPTGGNTAPEGFDFVVLATDLSGLPTVARWLEQMPAGQRGAVFVEFGGAKERIELAAPLGVEVRWLDREGVPAGRSDVLNRHIRSVVIPQGSGVYVWVAGEAATVAPLRRWVTETLGLGPDEGSVNGLWEYGADFDRQRLSVDSFGTAGCVAIDEAAAAAGV